MAFSEVFAGLTILLSVLTVIYLLFYLYLWKQHPCCNFEVIDTAHWVYIGIALFTVSNALVALHAFQAFSAFINDAAVLFNFLAMAAFFAALYLKIKETSYEHLNHGKAAKTGKRK